MHAFLPYHHLDLVLNIFLPAECSKSQNKNNKLKLQTLQPYIKLIAVRGTWRIWSNISTIGVNFSTTFKLHKCINITLAMSLYMYI